MSIYEQLEAAVLPLLEDFQTDLTVHDRAAIEARPGCPFIVWARSTGTDMTILRRAKDFPPEGVKVPYLFGWSDREHILDETTAVAEARLRPKRGEVLEWTNVHRYEIRRNGAGCELNYSLKVMRLSRKPWWTKRGMRGLATKISTSYTRGGFRNLLAMAEESAGVRSAG